MRANLPRQRQQSFGNFRGHIFRRHILGDRSALVAALDVRPEPPALERDSLAQVLRPFAGLLAAWLTELLGVAAFRIVGAGDERSKLAAAERQPAVAALRADARVAAVRARRIEPWREKFVQRGGNLARLLVHDLARLGLEVAAVVIEQ